MNLHRLPTHTRSRMSIRLAESNDMPLHSHVSILINEEEERRKDDNLHQFLNNNLRRTSRLSMISRISTQSNRRSISYGMTTSSSIDHKMMLQILTQQAADQLAIILNKMCNQKSKLYLYQTPEERFNVKEEYTLEEHKPLKTDEEKMLKIQQLIKAKIEKVIMFLYSILRDTSEEMRIERTYRTLGHALDNIFKTESDDFNILNMKADELCAQLFHDIKRIEKEAERFLEGNRQIAYGSLLAKDRQYFINLKQLDYMEKWEKSRRWLLNYKKNKELNNISDYIHDIEHKMIKEEETTIQITTFLNFDIVELQRKRDEYPEKLDNERDMRTRVNAQLREEIENMKIHNKEMAAEIKLRTKQMIEWKIYRDKKAIEDAEIQRIIDEEELAKKLQAERIAAELAAEEEYLATLTPKERVAYLKNKKIEARKAAKAKKAAARAAKKKERRTA